MPGKALVSIALVSLSLLWVGARAWSRSEQPPAPAHGSGSVFSELSSGGGPAAEQIVAQGERELDEERFEELKAFQRRLERDTALRGGAILMPGDKLEPESQFPYIVASDMEDFFKGIPGVGLSSRITGGRLTSQTLTRVIDEPFLLGLFVGYGIGGRPEERYWFLTKRWAHYQMKVDDEFAIEFLRSGKAPEDKLMSLEEQFEREYESSLDSGRALIGVRCAPHSERVEAIIVEPCGLVVKPHRNEASGAVGAEVVVVIAERLGAAPRLQPGDVIVEVKPPSLDKLDLSKYDGPFSLVVERGGQLIQVRVADPSPLLLLQGWALPYCQKYFDRAPAPVK